MIHVVAGEITSAGDGEKKAHSLSPTTNPTADTITVHLIQRISPAFSMANLQLPETVGW